MRVAIGIDPGDRSGVTLWSDTEGPTIYPVVLSNSRTTHESTAALMDSQLAVLSANHPAGVEWAAAIERPFNRRGPVEAVRFWKKTLDLLARNRAVGRFRKPTIVCPHPQTWRSQLGLPVRGYVKRAAQEHLFRTSGIKCDDHDLADSACLADWLLGCARVGYAEVGSKAHEIKWVP